MVLTKRSGVPQFSEGSMTIRAMVCAGIATAAVASAAATGLASAGKPEPVQYRVLATNKTSTMQKEMQEAADAGFRFAAVMGGETAFGGSEVVTIMTRHGSPGQYQYRLLATNRTSTMQKEMQEASDGGFEYRGQTVFKSMFGGKEVAAIFERDANATPVKYEYHLLATSKTSTMQKELDEAGAQGFDIVGMTVGKTAIGGDEVVAIMRRVVE
ncbi:MAG TPA: hypothetical protein VFX12_02495 [Vicinamibacterales bacterium]|nr:hypothetical protein [Vicinamibacterales bacterium]